MYNINSDRLVSTFTDLVKISSPSWQEHEVMAYITGRLENAGIPYKKIPAGNSFNLYASAGDIGKNSILLSAHMDTVVPCENVKPMVRGNRITSDGTTILGGDDKAAIAMFIEALEIIREKKIKHSGIEILLSCAEEVGLQGIKLFDMKQIKSKQAYVFDSNGDIGKIILKAPYHYKIKINISGKAAHAGMEPEKGINAINVLAEIVSRIPSRRIDPESTINVGTISGGKATNIVAEQAECRIETRSINHAKVKAELEKVKKTVKQIADKHKAKYKIEITPEYSGFTLTEKDIIVRRAANAMKRIKINPEYISSGGGSDTNVFNKNGIKAVNLSCGMSEVHTTKEYIKISDLKKGTELVLSLIEESGKA